MRRRRRIAGVARGAPSRAGSNRARSRLRDLLGIDGESDYGPDSTSAPLGEQDLHPACSAKPDRQPVSPWLPVRSYPSAPTSPVIILGGSIPRFHRRGAQGQGPPHAPAWRCWRPDHSRTCGAQRRDQHQRLPIRSGDGVPGRVRYRPRSCRQTERAASPISRESIAAR